MVPNRLLREGICTSDAVNALSPEEEVLFYRLLVACDDFGYADGRLAIIKSLCFPLRDGATTERLDEWLTGLARNGLIQRYLKDGKPFIAVNQWEQRVRSRAKFPGPMDAGCQPHVGGGTDELRTNVRQLSDSCPTDDGLGKGKGKGMGRGDKHPISADWLPTDKTIADLSREFGLRVPEDVNRYVAAFIDACKAKGYQYSDFDAAFRNCVRQDWPKLRGADGKIIAARPRSFV